VSGAVVKKYDIDGAREQKTGKPLPSFITCIVSPHQIIANSINATTSLCTWREERGDVLTSNSTHSFLESYTLHSVFQNSQT
jgi:hypothetical protein